MEHCPGGGGDGGDGREGGGGGGEGDGGGGGGLGGDGGGGAGGVGGWSELLLFLFTFNFLVIIISNAECRFVKPLCNFVLILRPPEGPFAGYLAGAFFIDYGHHF